MRIRSSFLRRCALTLAALGAVLSSSGCAYFVSNNVLDDKFNYPAASDTSSLRLGDKVYQYKGEFYVELPRYKKGHEPRLVRWSDIVGDLRPQRNILSGTQTFRLSHDLSLYMLGYESGSSFNLTAVNNDNAMKYGKSFSIVRLPQEPVKVRYNYSSGNLLTGTFWLLDAICVDIPVSLLINASNVALVGIPFSANHRAKIREEQHFTKPKVIDGVLYEPCPHCKGAGSVIKQVPNPKYRGDSGGSWTNPLSGRQIPAPNQPRYIDKVVDCYQCGGSGKIRSWMPAELSGR